MMSISKVAFVAGCGSSEPGWGNGKAICALFARQGAQMFGIDLTLQAAQETCDIVRAEGSAMDVCQANVTADKDVRDAVAACVQRFGRVDILNVGRSEPGDPVALAEHTWDEQIEVNLKGAFLMCRHVIPIMLRHGGGAIVNVSSVAGLQYVGKPQVGYAAAKAGLMQLTRTRAVVHAAAGIHLNSVVPGLMDTPLVRGLADNYADGDYDAFVASRNKQVPMGRMGNSWDVAHAALFLVSDEARYVTGTQLVVDGGLTAATR